MASKTGRAGTTAREMAERRALIRAGFGLIAMIVVWVFLKVMPHAQAAGIGTIVVLFVAFKVVMNILESKIDTKIAEEKRAVRVQLPKRRSRKSWINSMMSTSSSTTWRASSATSITLC